MSVHLFCCVSMNEYVYASVNECVCLVVCVYECAYVCLNECVTVYGICVCVCLCTNECASVFGCVCMYEWVSVFGCVCVWVNEYASQYKMLYKGFNNIHTLNPHPDLLRGQEVKYSQPEHKPIHL